VRVTIRPWCLVVVADATGLDDGLDFEQAVDELLKPEAVASSDPGLDWCAALCPDPSQRPSFVARLQAKVAECDQAFLQTALQKAEELYFIATGRRSLRGRLQPSQRATLQAPLQPMG